MPHNEKQLQIQKQLIMCYKIYKEYSWLLNAYVSDFYVYKYWAKLPQPWRNTLENSKPEILADIIDPFTSNEFQLLPLSFLALRKCIKHLIIPRTQEFLSEDVSIPEQRSLFNTNIAKNEHFKNSFWKRIKLKKKYEIELIAKMCSRLANETHCHYIVDVGSGLGHLSRILCYKYGLRVCALEAQEYLTTEAKKLDSLMENTIKNYFNISMSSSFNVTHINMRVKTDFDGADILDAVKLAFGVDNIQFGIVGLHPCGDLGPALLRLFRKSPQVKFVNIVGCCYMKLTTPGYPLSTFGINNNFELDYCAREVACHALEAYIDKLKISRIDQLKVHAYRAALEKLIVQKVPSMYHSQVNSVKCTDGLSFLEYCNKAISGLKLDLNLAEIESNEIKNDLNDWRNVVAFYSLRLMLAPLIEHIIMLDRILYILESGYHCEVTALFDPKLSPRNQVLTATK